MTNWKPPISWEKLALIYLCTSTLTLYHRLGSLRSGLATPNILAVGNILELCLVPFWIILAIWGWKVLIRWAKSEARPNHIQTLNAMEAWDWKAASTGFFLSCVSWYAAFRFTSDRSTGTIFAQSVFLGCITGIIASFIGRLTNLFPGAWVLVGYGYGSTMIVSSWLGILTGLAGFVSASIAFLVSSGLLWYRTDPDNPSE